MAQLLYYLKEWYETLSWALDVLDLYDKRLAQIDGEERVLTEKHVAAKERARGHLRQMKRGLQSLQDETDSGREGSEDAIAGLDLESLVVGYALANSYEAGRTYPDGFFGVDEEGERELRHRILEAQLIRLQSPEDAGDVDLGDPPFKGPDDAIDYSDRFE